MELSKKVSNCMNQSDLQVTAQTLYVNRTKELLATITDIVATMEKEGVEIPASLADKGIAFTEKQYAVISAMQELLIAKYELMVELASVAVADKQEE